MTGTAASRTSLSGPSLSGLETVVAEHIAAVNA